MNEKLELKYKEMIRLAEKADDYAKSAFEDFKMLGALGALVAWKPFVEILDARSDTLLFVGFLSILAIIAIIGFFGLLKQSVVNFYLAELRAFEREVRAEMNDPETRAFRVAEHWIARGSGTQRRIARRFYGLFYVVLIVYPSALLLSENAIFAAVYGLSAVAIAGLHYNTATIVHGKPHEDADRRT